MALEVERKYLNADPESLRSRLARLSALGPDRHFEENLVFDDAQGSLRHGDVLLRLRRAGDRALLTVKRRTPESRNATCKVREEVEVKVGDFFAARTILEALGFSPAMAYEKVREAWRLHECQVCLDILPFGFFVEIEGTEDRIDACARELGLAALPSSCATYHELHQDWLRQQGLPPRAGFSFSESQRRRLEEELERPAGAPRQPG